MLFSTSIRLGVIEEEREEDERRLNAAMAAAERMNVLVSHQGQKIDEKEVKGTINCSQYESLLIPLKARLNTYYGALHS